jgi:hypothetical protein
VKKLSKKTKKIAQKEQSWKQKSPPHLKKKAKTKGIPNSSQTLEGKSSQIDRSNFHNDEDEENEENYNEEEDEDESQNYYQENFLRMENLDEESLAAYLSTRELNENDYELLLRLDENLTKKTLEEEKLSKILIIQKESTDLTPTTCLNCTVCLENFKKDEIVSILPCKHEFHQLCIETWLKEYSKLCPLCKNEM